MSIFRTFNRFPSTDAASSIILREVESQDRKDLKITELCQNSSGEIFLQVFNYRLEETRSFSRPISKELCEFLLQEHEQTPLLGQKSTESSATEISKGMTAEEEDKVINKDDTDTKSKTKENATSDVAKEHMCQKRDKEKEKDYKNDIKETSKESSELLLQQQGQTPQTRPALTKGNIAENVNIKKEQNHKSDKKEVSKEIGEFSPQQQGQIPLSRPASTGGNRVETSKTTPGKEETKLINNVKLRNNEATGNIYQKMDKEKEKDRKSDVCQKVNKDNEKDHRSVPCQKEDKEEGKNYRRDIYVNENKGKEKCQRTDTCKKGNIETNNSDIKGSQRNEKSSNMVPNERGDKCSTKQKSESESIKISHEGGRPRNSGSTSASQAPPLSACGRPLRQGAPQVLETPKNWHPRPESTTASVHERPIYVEKDPEGQFKSLLNKLSPINFETVSDQICIHLEENPSTINGAVELICFFARLQQFYSRTYSVLCYALFQQLTGGKGLDFKNCLLFHCQELFEERRFMAASRKSKRSKPPPREEEAENKLSTIQDRKHYVALCAFLANLSLENIFPTRKLITCVQALLVDQKDDTAIESICILLHTAGKKMEHNAKPSIKDTKKLSDIFSTIREIVDKKLVSTRLRYLLVDVLELKERGWQPRTQKH